MNQIAQAAPQQEGGAMYGEAERPSLQATLETSAACLDTGSSGSAANDSDRTDGRSQDAEPSSKTDTTQTMGSVEGVTAVDIEGGNPVDWPEQSFKVAAPPYEDPRQPLAPTQASIHGQGVEAGSVAECSVSASKGSSDAKDKPKDPRKEKASMDTSTSEAKDQGEPVPYNGARIICRAYRGGDTVRPIARPKPKPAKRKTPPTDAGADDKEEQPRKRVKVEKEKATPGMDGKQGEEPTSSSAGTTKHTKGSGKSKAQSKKARSGKVKSEAQ